MSSLVSSHALDGYGYWLAGLMDGEGSFTITPNRPGFVCRTTIGLRDDDSAILEEIAARTGLGKTLLNRRHVVNPNAHPLSLWRVERKLDCQVIVEVFDAFPLRTKKARDYAIWREAVFAMAAMTGTVAAGRPRDWTEVARLKERLADARRHPGLLLVPGVAGAS